MSSKGKDKGDKLSRIVIVNKEKCKPKKCRQECKRNCPVVRGGKQCVDVTPTSKVVWISEELCIGCSICVKKCPMDALHVINLPTNLASNTTHRYGANSFKLHRLPMPRPGQVLGLVGTNGIGKTTALKILAGKLKPNMCKWDTPPDWQEILTNYRGSELQNYLQKILEDNYKAIIKPQYVDHIPRAVKGTVKDILAAKNAKGGKEEYIEKAVRILDLEHVREREIDALSGGELQRFAIATLMVQDADVYMFDEPSSYLDVRQRLKAAQTIRSIIDRNPKAYVLAVEHDLSVLDYLSDFVCCLYGKAGGYGVVSMPYSVREGINVFLAGFIPTENLRFREEDLNFKMSTVGENQVIDKQRQSFGKQYPDMTKTMVPKKAGKKPFILHVKAGSFVDSEIIVMLGENGTGKTTFIRMLAGLLKSDEKEKAEKEDADNKDEIGVPPLHISYKPQKISPKFPGTVADLMMTKIREAFIHPQFITDVVKPMMIDNIKDNLVKNLSGGELQRVAITLCLGKPADVYLIDEPSAYLDSEQRIVCSKVIKRYILHAKKTAFVVEHDFIMATYLADRVVVYEGQPAVECTANTPEGLIVGMNRFLEHLCISFRRDPTNYRPRINKPNSVKDVEQKTSGNFFFADMD